MAALSEIKSDDDLLEDDQLSAKPSHALSAMHTAPKPDFTRIKKESTAAAKKRPRETSTALPENVQPFCLKIEADCSYMDFGFGDNTTDAN